MLAYRLARLITSGEVSEALGNARHVLHLEDLLGLPSELALQRAALSWTWLVEAANVYYAVVHFPATVAFLVWTYVRRRERYPWVRNTLIGLTAVALAVHLFTPLAPPRMLEGLGFVDTGAVLGPAVYGPPETDHVTNQYAAMPSLHVGWAVFVALGLVVMTRGRWRWLWLLHPAVTVLVVVATANHYWLDGIVAVVLLGLVLLAQRRPRRRHRVAAPPPRLPVPAPRAGADDPSRVLDLTEVERCRSGCRRP
ncbi:inositol phosphorylceramide synthase [Vallicoccus soli]|uniref:Inositol phosphorylceramide synthase n=2 Tax=Vallicoccus soli TaxID=2339232 RepID=A0A3A3ZIY2_9ACTN|nr:inositol phosphorylceramide synthase [Vallicoccus soli]